MTEIIRIDDGQSGYHEVVSYVLTHGEPRTARGHTTLDAGHVTVEIADPHNALPLYTGRGVSRHVAAAEAVQLVGGFSQPSLLPPAFDRFKEPNGGFWGAYGVRIATQLPHAVRKLQADEETRQATITLWDPLLDNQRDKHDYPCTVALGFRLSRRGGLELNVLMRSNDVYLGTPYDWFQFTQLQLSVARVLRVDPGTYRHTAWSLHVYDEDVKRARQVTPPTRTDQSSACGVGADDVANIYDLMARARALVTPMWWDLIGLTESERWYANALGLAEVAG